MKVADFFCGGGGFSEGFRQAGFEIVFAVDNWQPAVDTYKGNKPSVNVIKDDVLRISKLDDEEFEKIVPDTEVIIGSPPCQAFSQSNKSGSADKTIGIQLIEAYLRIVARKKFKKNSILQYWVLENVPNSQNYIKEIYTPEDLELEGEWTLNTRGEGSGIYNAKYFGAPTNRKRFLCGLFPTLVPTHTDEDVVTLGEVVNSIGVLQDKKYIVDINYPNLVLPAESVTDYKYVHELAPFEWKTALRLKQDKGYMGRMAFPENLDKPSRTVMATMTASSREAMILEIREGKYRLPTVREAASMMSFPLDYWFYGNTRGIKHTLVGNAVPPKLAYAVARAIAENSGEDIPNEYIPIKHDEKPPFLNLNGKKIPINKERPKRSEAKFKYHIPYLIEKAYRVELTNYGSKWETKEYEWQVEIHYSQGKRAKVYLPNIRETAFDKSEIKRARNFIKKYCEKHLMSFNTFQEAYCMTSKDRKNKQLYGPFELLKEVKKQVEKIDNKKECVVFTDNRNQIVPIPRRIAFGYYLLFEVVEQMRKER